LPETSGDQATADSAPDDQPLHEHEAHEH
jgi:hypothetical protein